MNMRAVRKWNFKYLKKGIGAFVLTGILCQCQKSSSPTPAPPAPPPAAVNFEVVTQTVNGASFNATQTLRGISNNPVIQISFSDKVDRNSVAPALGFQSKSQNAATVAFNVSYQKNDSSILITPVSPVGFLAEYIFTVSSSLKSVSSKNLSGRVDLDFFTQLDPSDKFPLISDSALVQLVQQQTFNYFWNFAHPVSGLARERNTSGDVATSGGSGFGIMAIVTGVHRNFINRRQGLDRLKTIVSFLKNKAQTFKGAYPHWLNGATGEVVPFSTLDNGADLVETAYLVQGLLTARQYFNGVDAEESALRADINEIWKAVDWNWFRKNGENTLYWHWSPSNAWAMNMPVKGWNEALITYVLAASSPTFSITKSVYDNGWAANGAIRNGQTYYGIPLPLGPAYGGPLFFAHYSFLGLNPNGLSDAYASSYLEQNKAHSLINYKYCVANPKGFYGYSDSAWGLTASDIPNGYTASSPTNDVGVIAPTAALSSFPYTPAESMKALKFFYYRLGDKLWGPYGFYDAFSLQDPWFANSYLAIDQGPILIMMENYRSGLLWNLFMSCPEVKQGLKNLGFQSPFI